MIKSNCSMTFYFSFEVLLKLKPIQTNIKGGGASNRENPYNNFLILVILEVIVRFLAPPVIQIKKSSSLDTDLYWIYIFKRSSRCTDIARA